MRCSLVLCCLLLLCRPGRAAEADLRTPTLVVDTGMHSGAVTSLARDRAGRTLLTASVDGTVRIWDLGRFSLLRTLRPPAGQFLGEGSLYAVRLSPDGRTVAVGGLTQYFDLRNRSGSSIYLFDLQGHYLRRLPGAAARSSRPEVEAVTELAFSSDGSRLAAARGWGQADVRPLRGGAALPDLKIPEDRVNSLDLDRRGRLVLIVPGGLRLYDSALRPLREVRTTEDTSPQRVRFSPDGTKLAVLYHDSAVVEVRSAADLAPLYRATAASADVRGLAFVPEGRRLCVGGTRGVRCFADEGRGAATDSPTGGGLVLDLLPLPGGALAFGTDAPSWGVLEPGGRLRHLERARALAPPPAELLVDATGHNVQVPAAQEGRVLRYAVRGRLLSSHPRAAADPALLAPLANTIKHPPEPSPLRCSAMLRDGSAAIIGTESDLVVYEASGKQRFRVSLPGGVRAVNSSGDGRLVVAALWDGTLRWYRASDGEERLAVYLHPDGRRFVAFTPAGLYDASVGGEALVGWHSNPETEDAPAQFVPAALLRGRFYRPEQVAAALDGLSSARQQPVQRAELTPLLPPQVTILSPLDGARVSREAALQVALRSPSGDPITGLKVMVDGRQVAAKGAALPGKGGEPQTLTVPLPAAAQTYTVSVLAETARVTGEPALVQVQTAAEPAISDEQKPRLLMLAVGVSAYQKPELRLQLAAKDAREVTQAFRAQAGRLYGAVEARLLTNAEATKERILDGLEWLQQESRARDLIVLFLSGHGVSEPETGQYHFLPVEGDPQRLLRTALSGAMIQSALAGLSGKVLLFIDTCHAANVLARGQDMTRFINELASAERGVVVFASSSGRQASQEAAEWGNGAFTRALLEGLAGKADFQGKGRVTLTMLDLYISERVRELTQGTQVPATAKPITVPDFPLVLR